jgi:hypothetical protein
MIVEDDLISLLGRYRSLPRGRFSPRGRIGSGLGLSFFVTITYGFCMSGRRFEKMDFFGVGGGADFSRGFLLAR